MIQRGVDGDELVARRVLNDVDTQPQAGHSPGGVRTWWRRWQGGRDDQFDDTHLIRLAGRFARRVRAFAAANVIAVIDCGPGERKHLIAEEYLASHEIHKGVFLILVAKAVAPAWRASGRSWACC